MATQHTAAHNDGEIDVDSANPPHLACFHCAQPLSRFTTIQAQLGDQQQAFCCHGCEAAATFIHGRGLADFYQRRRLDQQADLQRAQVGDRAVQQDWSFLDNAELAGSYVHTNEDGERSLKLKVSGLYCSSCSWLINRTLKDYSESISINVNATAKIVYLRFSDPDTQISIAIQHIEMFGYAPVPVEIGESVEASAAQQQQDSRNALKRIAVAGFGMMQVMTYAVALYFGDYQGMQSDYHRFLNLVSLLVATVVVFYSGRPFFHNAWQDLKNRHLGMDVPIALAIAGAYWPSVYQTLFRGEGHVYFDSAVMFIFFLSVGRYIEMRARHRLSPAPVALRSLLPNFIVVQRTIEGDKVERQIEPQSIEVGDEVELQSRQVVPFDGRIVTGAVQVDESSTSGESVPVLRQTGDLLSAGSIISSGTALLQATAKWANSSIATTQNLLDQAHTKSNQPIEGAQHAAQYFIAAILVATCVVGLVWWFIAPDRVFQIVLAMLVASCPCAFSLATPVAVAAASRKLRENGLLLANFEALSILPKVSSWCFDKTGTLTYGRPKITQITTHGSIGSEQCVAIAAALEQHSNHVLSNAFAALCNPAAALEVEHHAGNGVSGIVENVHYILGKPEWIKPQLPSTALTEYGLAMDNKSTLIMLANNEQLLATFVIQDELRTRTEETLNYLRDKGKKLAILSGDREPPVAALATELSIKDYSSNLSSAQKLQNVQARQQKGEVVAMVGDGVNDAPVLAQADLKLAIASGSELSHCQADVVILHKQLNALVKLHAVAAKTQAIILQNKVWAVLYNLIALPLAAAGFLNPWLAALGMSISSLLVVLNALRIVRNT